MVDLSKMIQLVEATVEQLEVQQEHIDPLSRLDDLQGKVAPIVEGPVAENGAILKAIMSPPASGPALRQTIFTAASNPW